MVVHKEDYIAKEDLVRAKLQWIQEGNEGSKFFFDFLKRKVVTDKVLGLWREDGIFEDNQIEIWDMFSCHFKNILFDTTY